MRFYIKTGGHEEHVTVPDTLTGGDYIALVVEKFHEDYDIEFDGTTAHAQTSLPMTIIQSDAEDARRLVEDLRTYGQEFLDIYQESESFNEFIELLEARLDMAEGFRNG